MLSSNPTISGNIFARTREVGAETMTVSGTVNKSFLLLALVFASALWSWQVTWGQIQMPDYAGFPSIVMVSAIIGFAIAMLTVFVKKLAPYTSPVYALAQGVVLGSLSAVMEFKYGGIVFQAVLGTFGTFFFMLFMYRSKMIQATEGFKKGMTIALGGIFFIYLVSFILGFFGKQIPYIHQSGPIGIAFSFVVVGLAAFSFILDFNSIEEGERVGAPKYMEWYGAFGLLVTLIWLYIEILRLLSKFRDRR
jgi:uncharacterized YccA/Bax inhibitor family protein